MGLYIPNAKIPVSCNKCYDIGLAHRLRDLGGHCPRMDLHYSPDEQDFKGDRRADCPLLDVPPHGRCVDVDALKTKGPDTRDTWVDYDGREDTVMGFSLDMLDHAPTVIPADPPKELRP